LDASGRGEPDAESIAQALRDADKSPDELRKAVELFGQRRQWRRCYNRLQELAAESKEIERQLAAANEVLEEAHQEYDG
jgi:hypothetical protein